MVIIIILPFMSYYTSASTALNRVQYTINGHDIITATSDGFDAFASANNASQLSDQVLGQVIWKYMYSEDVNRVYQRLFAAVRQSGKKASMTFRCDSHEVLRFMQIHVEPQAEAHLLISTDTIREVPRARVLASEILYNGIQSGLPMCSHCNRIKVEEHGWTEIDAALKDNLIPTSLSVTFDLCGQCTEEFDATIQQLGQA